MHRLKWQFWLILLLRSPFPWFYFIFFMCMIIHRTQRDVARCRRKYGKAWEQYEKQVPYLFIPVSSTIILGISAQKS